jgi:hypothetical protein
MNKRAEKHLAAARDHIARGEAYYRKAAVEIVAAMNDDPTLGQREIAERVGRSQRWVSDLVRWSTSEQDRVTPWAEDSPARTERAARQVLRDADDDEAHGVAPRSSESECQFVRSRTQSALLPSFRPRASRGRERRDDGVERHIVGVCQHLLGRVFVTASLDTIVVEWAGFLVATRARDPPHKIPHPRLAARAEGGCPQLSTGT